MKRVTFIHAADLHLDSPMLGLADLPKPIFKRLQESSFEALRKITDAAILHHVDFVIISGDLFDAEDRSIKAQTKFRKEMERLDEKGIPVFIIHGNHDFADGNWVQVDMPDNVYVFPTYVETVPFTSKDGIKVHLYGFSYPKRHVYEEMISHYKKVSGADFHIGILHGNADGGSEHEKYAPFSVKDLLEKDFDYWALGHIHKRGMLHDAPAVIYPGNIQGRHRKETGQKGCYLVELTHQGANLQFIETSTVMWEQTIEDAAQADTFQDIYAMCKEIIEQYRLDQKGIILSLVLENINLPAQDLKPIWNGELLEILQEEEKDEENFVWVTEISLVEKVNWTHEQLANESEFYSELFAISRNAEELNESIEALYHHPSARRYLGELKPDEIDILANEAESLLVKLLYSK